MRLIMPKDNKGATKTTATQLGWGVKHYLKVAGVIVTTVATYALAKRLISPRGCCRFFRSTRASLQGGFDLPHWLGYGSEGDSIYSKGVVADDIGLAPFVIQVRGKDNLITEEFVLHPPPQPLISA